MMISSIYEGQKNQTVIDKFTPLVKRSIDQFINDRMISKFKETLSLSEDVHEEIDVNVSEEELSKIDTTVEELNVFAIIKAILRREVKVNRLVYKDTESYFGILLDNNSRKLVCRLKLGVCNEYLIIPDENKKEVRYPIESLDDLYNFSDEQIESLKRYLI